MNLIVNKRLDRQEELAIYELTLKKKRSKKSTLSQRHLEAMQQLANELLPERRALVVAAAAAAAALACLPDGPHNPQVAETSGEATAVAVAADKKLADSRTNFNHSDICRCNSTATTASSIDLQRQSSTSTIATTSTSSSTTSCATSNIGSSLSTASSASLQSNSSSLGQSSGGSLTASLPLKITNSIAYTNVNCNSTAAAAAANTTKTNSAVGGGGDFVNIKLSQMRLEQLNNELERRLHQYEYLVAQEKAILGSYNKALFTHEGVNNFHLYRHNQQKF